MTTVYRLTELLPCPFCGSAAAYYGAAVRCTSFKCNAGLSPDWTTRAVRSVQCNPDERLRQAQVETAERWNRRASQAAPAPSDALREAVMNEAADAVIAWRDNLKREHPGNGLAYAYFTNCAASLRSAAITASPVQEGGDRRD